MSENKTYAFSFTTPESGDEFGRWLEMYYVTMTISSTWGQYEVRMERKVLHSYNDRDGEYASRWEVCARGKDLPRAIQECYEAMCRTLPAEPTTPTVTAPALPEPPAAAGETAECSCPHLRNKPITVKSRHISSCPWSNS